MAQQQQTRRLLQALIREELLSLSKDEQGYLIPLPRHKGFLLLDHIEQHSLSRYQIQGDIVFFSQDLQPQKITSPLEILKIVGYELHGKIDLDQWEHFTSEIHNQINNDTLNNQTTATIPTKTKPFSQPDLFYEQIVVDGHPYHPCSKTKLGFSKDDVIKYSPEFHPNVDIILAALEKDSIHIEANRANADYQQWFIQQFPDIMLQWQQQMQQLNLATTNYVPFFIHPWQLDHIIHEKFANLITNKKCIIFNKITLTTHPTLSFRTVVPTFSKHAPHIKLPVAIQTTSAMRTVSPASTENGPKISSILHSIMEKEHYFGNRIRIMEEQFGLHVTGFTNDDARHLSVIYRDNPNKYLQKDETAIVVAALFVMIQQLLHECHITTQDQAFTYFENYVDIVLGSYLDLYLKYGIALEGHQQNTLAIFKDGTPIGMIARDFGGMRTHLPSLEARGYQFQPYPNSATFCNDRYEVCAKLLHTVYQFHLGEWVLALAYHFQCEELPFWDIVKKKTIERFNALKKTIPAETWQEDYNAILKNAWPLKALLRMRLENTSHQYIYLSMPNPLTT